MLSWKTVLFFTLCLVKVWGQYDSAPEVKKSGPSAAVYDGLGGNYAAEQVDPKSPYVNIPETHPPRASSGVSPAVYSGIASAPSSDGYRLRARRI